MEAKADAQWYLVAQKQEWENAIKQRAAALDALKDELALREAEISSTESQLVGREEAVKKETENQADELRSEWDAIMAEKVGLE